MKVGDLVRIKRASIGVPMDTLGLVEAKLKDTGGFSGIPDAMWRVCLLQAGRRRHYLGRDLEVLS